MRLSSLITNILKLNKLENQQIFPEMRKMNLSDSVCECLLGFEQIWEDKKIEIITDIDDEIEIFADKDMLSLVWKSFFQCFSIHRIRWNGAFSDSERR